MDFWNVSEMDYFNCRDPFDGKEPSFSRGLAIVGTRLRIGSHEQIMRAVRSHCFPGARALVGSVRPGRAPSLLPGPGLSSALPDLVVPRPPTP